MFISVILCNLIMVMMNVQLWENLARGLVDHAVERVLHRNILMIAFYADVQLAFNVNESLLKSMTNNSDRHKDRIIRRCFVVCTVCRD